MRTRVRTVIFGKDGRIDIRLLWCLLFAVRGSQRFALLELGANQAVALVLCGLYRIWFAQIVANFYCEPVRTLLGWQPVKLAACFGDRKSYLIIGRFFILEKDTRRSGQSHCVN